MAGLRPSKAATWVNCPGSIQQSDGLPDNSGPAAADGTASHYVAATMLKTGEILEPGQTAENGVILTEEMVLGALDYTKAIARCTPTDAGIAVEEECFMPAIHPELSGTPDFWYYSPSNRVLSIWDYKFGFGVVEARENWQLLCYASGAMEIARGNTPLGAFQQGLTVELNIYQPRAYHPLGPYRTWSIDGDGLFRGYINRLEQAAKLAYSANARVCAGDHCKYCLARYCCPALQKAASLASEFTEEICPVHPSMQDSATELTILRKMRGLLDYRITGIEARLTEAIEQGEFVPGYALENGPGRREWSCPVVEVLSIGDMFGIDLRKPTEPITPTQAKKAGVPKDIVDSFSDVQSKSKKLVSTTNSLAATIFKGEFA